ncbi:glycosyltransferase family 39 protein [Haloferax namakaokahaiae]|uniref:Glycosyltransferase family 39 protein n=1 Tax=Haloferax namakaokahaiae TaxID=1748331 RepID=A0ABD5ZBE4_9EURY
MTVRDTSAESSATATIRSVAHAAPLTPSDRYWLFLAMLPGLVAAGVYLFVMPYPGYGAGLYAKIALELQANGYLLPARIPGYTVDGVPFAYPPLQFYILAVLFDLGFDPIAVARVLPAIAVIATQIPVYLLTRDITESRPTAAIATALVVLNPQVLQWHISAGGVVRAFAFLYAMVAIYAGYHVFTSGNRRAMVLGAAAFGLTVLTHPTYTLFVVATYLLFWVVLDRSLIGFGRGALVGIGGLSIAAPWLWWVLSTHGLDVFTAAAGTHGGIGGGLEAAVAFLSPYHVLLLAAIGYLVVRREYLLVSWLVVVAVLFQQSRFAYAVGGIALATALYDLTIRARLFGRLQAFSLGRFDRRAIGTVFLVVGIAVGGVYVSSEFASQSDPLAPAFIDDSSVEAMEWAAAETPPDATFVVVGDAAEWFPMMTDRTILIGPWGVEWEGDGPFERQITAYETSSECQTATCVEQVAASVGGSPDYVYVPRGRYTIRGHGMVTFGSLERSFDRSPKWQRAYENRDVIIYRSKPVFESDESEQ